MIARGLAYGLLSTRRRLSTLLLPIVTTATGAFLVVQVFSFASSIRNGAGSLGNRDAIVRATLLIALIVLLVGVVEVAVCTTRTINHRTREIGVLGATGVRRRPVVAALMVEPLISAAIGAAFGALVAVAADSVLSAAGATSTAPSAGGTLLGVGLALGVSVASAAATSIVPSWRAASRPPIKSLSQGG